MEQAKRTSAHIERILLVCGNQNAGKSRLIRHMYSDKRLAQAIASTRGPLPTIPLSRERCLAGRSTSPHEMNETPADFHKKIDDAAKSAWANYWRINYISAVQPNASNLMPGIVDTCEALKREFMPERIRVVQLFPDQSNDELQQHISSTDIDGLRKLDVEIISIDARRSSHPAEPGNIRILADFFDFS